jgi:DNA-binding CsgD family transcriptional regulator
MTRSALVLRTFLDVADGIVRAEPGWPDELVRRLERGVGAETVGFASGLEPNALGYSTNVGGPPLSDEERLMWVGHHAEYPFLENLLHGGEGRAERASDRLRRDEFRRTVVYAEHFAPRRSRYQANFGLVAVGRTAMVGLYRATRDFTVEEISVLERGRTLLVRALQYRDGVDELAGLCEVARPRATPATVLTRRQQEVLALVATGATDRRIARRLQISERTVRKHLDDVRERLGVGGRVAATAWWLTNGRPTTPEPRGLP